jgi:hypothetical protein
MRLSHPLPNFPALICSSTQNLFLHHVPQGVMHGRHGSTRAENEKAAAEMEAYRT